jgi:hypothetical protein
MDEKLEKLLEQVLRNHDQLFKDVAKQEDLDKLALSPRERDLAYHLVLNEKEIRDDIQVTHNPHYKQLPSSLPEIYVSHYKDRALNVIRKHLSQFNLSPEESATLEEFMKSTVGTKLLEPPQ